MKKSIYLFLVFFSTVVEIFSQTNLQIPLAVKVPVIDGKVTTNEWNDAIVAKIILDGNEVVEVSIKRDNEALYFLYKGSLGNKFLFPEVCFDVNNNGSSKWEEDDLWFHVSATDCFSKGKYSGYENCKLVQPDWQGVPNFEQGKPGPNEIEIKIHYTLATAKTEMGICFIVTNTFNSWKTWPQHADRNNPSTWGKLILIK